MATVSVTTDFSGAFRVLTGADKQARYATSLALNKTAEIAQKAIVHEMQRVFDRPTRWTLGGTRVIYAKARGMTSQVWLKDRKGGPASKENTSLFVQVFGGKRGRKAFETALMKAGLRSNEFLVPADGAPLDAFGNMPVGVIRQILSQLQSANTSAGYDSNTKNGEAQSGQSRRRQLRAGVFFIPPPKSGLPRGIYQRIPVGMSKAGSMAGKKRASYSWATRMIFKIVVGKPRYQIRLRIGEIGRRIADQHFKREFDTAYKFALATAR